MAQAVDVVVEKESANDADGTVVEVFFASGTSVTAGQRIFDIETSKAVQEIYAAVTGVLVHALKPGDTVMLGGAIAQIVSGDSAAAAEPPRPQQAAAATAPTRAVAVRESLPRLSREAAALASQYGLAAADFDRDLVTVADVRRHLNLVPPSPAPAAPTPTPITVAPVARAAAPPPVGDPVPRHKREEIEFLSRGAGASMLSVVGVAVGYGDLVREDEAFFETKIVDLVAYEASRLMHEHKKLNAAWRDGFIECHAAVNAGIALDNGGRLVVYGIESTDTLDLLDLQDEIMEGLKKYTGNKLTVKELTRATFTITDLAALGVDYVFPLLPQGQSCIIGITKSASAGFSLYLGFDHRVTEGLEASRFLAALRGRLVAALDKIYRTRQTCSFCGSIAPASGKGLLQLISGDGKQVLCCRPCWSEA